MLMWFDCGMYADVAQFQTIKEERVNCRQSRLITNQLQNMCADVAQLAEQLICNQQVIGSSPIIGFLIVYIVYMGRFPSGQRGQTVNLLQIASVVRIHLCPLSLIFD